MDKKFSKFTPPAHNSISLSKLTAPHNFITTSSSSSMNNWHETATRAGASGVAGAIGSTFMYGSGGTVGLPIIGTPVPAPVAHGVSIAAGSIAADVAQDLMNNNAIGQSGAVKLAVSLGVSGGVSGYLLQGETPGSFYENAALGALSYAAGDFVTAKYYKSPGRVF